MVAAGPAAQAAGANAGTLQNPRCQRGFFKKMFSKTCFLKVVFRKQCEDQLLKINF
jgi:hypothetical protein